MEVEAKEKNKIIHTFSDDMVGVLGENQGGVVKQLIAEELEREESKEDFSPDSQKNKIFIFSGIVLLLLSLAGILYVVVSKTQDTKNPPNTYQPLVFMDRNDFVAVDALDKNSLASTIFWQTEKRKIAKGKLEGIYLTENKKIIDSVRLFDLLETHTEKDSLKIFSANYSLGIYAGEDNTKHIFLLLPFSSFQEIFPLMKKWERDMFDDLHVMFGKKLDQTNRYLSTKAFEDGILQNKNARILFNKNNEIVLTYVYLDNQNILITDSEDVVREIMSRRLVGGQKR